ncbi:hypothetical protein SMD44_07288 [Streptomyces alboflavus]|uniref:Uncharacterized protein n=1 Tax=Streptomyces alboflavus TaxID=67267 RepID=A0A1Z1WMY3_9ACTN|nr:hypothetical protein SMD44_07288 [Streptomyces alboflavus]
MAVTVPAPTAPSAAARMAKLTAFGWVMPSGASSRPTSGEK